MVRRMSNATADQIQRLVISAVAAAAHKGEGSGDLRGDIRRVLERESSDRDASGRVQPAGRRGRHTSED
jgi:hypothetical protein